ncbi:hypothetical protein H7J77_00880 [Mycolicibacillus parakoreensis]|uniref:Transmembrane protein n=1 Tax=Mycolicibacillus parakoreensis TaxID=1069221 RepID=A0ABY3U256_9MYCO|nr:hypothetical protein [Mycolicibacillus parakoreensis]MCV7314105.1 hypothetical protein [Mycolicibacillus parakoreensis]ULN54045.1 hypothetical protein MIU77_07135 [Mycolicibacillus parakoreensis]
MLIIALVLAVIGLAALVFAIVTSNALVAWVCIGASVLGVLLLTADAVRERRRRSVSAAENEQPDIADPDTAEDAADLEDTADGASPDTGETGTEDAEDTGDTAGAEDGADAEDTEDAADGGAATDSDPADGATEDAEHRDS